jgi:hypothetical protein
LLVDDEVAVAQGLGAVLGQEVQPEAAFLVVEDPLHGTPSRSLLTRGWSMISTLRL